MPSPLQLSSGDSDALNSDPSSPAGGGMLSPASSLRAIAAAGRDPRVLSGRTPSHRNGAAAPAAATPPPAGGSTATSPRAAAAAAAGSRAPSPRPESCASAPTSRGGSSSRLFRVGSRQRLCTDAMVKALSQEIRRRGRTSTDASDLVILEPIGAGGFGQARGRGWV
jgi:hypothetical protein